MKTHRVYFQGAFDSVEEGIQVLGKSFEKYPEIENADPRLDDQTQEFVNFVNEMNKDFLTIIDFGGGQGGHYLTLKNNCSQKEFSYHIVDLPQSFIEIDNVKYYEGLEQIDKNLDIDIVYSNGTIYLTEGLSSLTTIHNFCKLQANYVLLQRMILSEGSSRDHFYTYVPLGKNYYSIINEDFLVEILQSYGYDCVYANPIYIKFNVIDAPDDIGVVQYKDFLFKKSDIK